MEKMVPTLGYWDMRGLAQPIRYLLKYKGIQFNDKRYPFGGTTSSEEVRKYWISDKSNLELDFPNLPFYMDANVKLTQSITIMRYLGIKYGLIANDEKSNIRQDLVEQQLQDLYVLFIFGILLNQPEFEKKVDIFSKQTLPQQLELLSKYLDQNEWFATNITFVDFYAYEILDWMRLFSPQCLDKWQNLTQFMKRFESLPAIASYLSSEEFKSWPILSPRSKWGHKK